MDLQMYATLVPNTIKKFHYLNLKENTFLAIYSFVLVVTMKKKPVSNLKCREFILFRSKDIFV